MDMDHSFTVRCDETVAREVSALAKRYDLTEPEVLRQLIEIGLEEVDRFDRDA